MYFPKQRYSSELTRISRQAMLPEEAVGTVEVEVAQVVSVRDTVAKGVIPGRLAVVDAATELGISPDELADRMLVSISARVDAGQPIAGRSAERGKRAFSPIRGYVIAVSDGKIIIQEPPANIKLDAGVRGRITEVIEGRGVKIEARGAILQGVWGNDRNVIATVRGEPERGGIESINPESLDTAFKNEIVITKTTLTAKKLEIAAGRGFAGIIAPSMNVSLLESVLNLPFAVMLTGGFGSMRMSQHASHLLSQFNGMEGMLDAAQPKRFTERRAELVINRPVAGDVADATQAKPLEVGMSVRITRNPHMGQIGTIVDLPQTPILLENGLSVLCAVVELMAEEDVDIPLANLEVAGT